MLELKFDSSSVSTRRSELMEYAAAAEAIRVTQGSRPAINYLLNSIGLRAALDQNDAYFSQALDYHLGIVYAHLNQPEKAAAHIAQIALLPNAGGEPLFSDYVRESLELHRQMMEARERGMPSILITSMPRSASTSLSKSLSATLTAPVFRVSAGQFPKFCVIPHWLNWVSPGGAVTHDHFGASDFNLRALKECGIQEIFVLVRDPRAAAASSLQKFLSLYREHSSPDQIESMIVKLLVDAYYPWLTEWIAASRTSGLTVRWIRSSELRDNMAGTIGRILENFRQLCPAVEPLLSNPQVVRSNFLVGDDSSWTALVGEATRKRLWDAMPAGVAELLQIQP